MTTRDTQTFLRAIVANPRQLGAIAPSSRRLGAVAARIVTTSTPAMTVVELGCGGGIITDVLREALPASSRLVGVEINEQLIEHLSATRPWLEVVHGSATELVPLLAERGVDDVDAVVSTLPWTLFDSDIQDRIIEQVAKILSPSGVFTTVITWPVVPFAPARRLRAKLRGAFGDVSSSRTVLRNVPPAKWYVCREPISG